MLFALPYRIIQTLQQFLIFFGTYFISDRFYPFQLETLEIGELGTLKQRWGSGFTRRSIELTTNKKRNSRTRFLLASRSAHLLLAHFSSISPFFHASRTKRVGPVNGKFSLNLVRWIWLRRSFWRGTPVSGPSTKTYNKTWVRTVCQHHRLLPEAD